MRRTQSASKQKSKSAGKDKTSASITADNCQTVLWRQGLSINIMTYACLMREMIKKGRQARQVNWPFGVGLGDLLWLMGEAAPSSWSSGLRLEGNISRQCKLTALSGLFLASMVTAGLEGRAQSAALSCSQTLPVSLDTDMAALGLSSMLCLGSGGDDRDLLQGAVDEWVICTWSFSVGGVWLQWICSNTLLPPTSLSTNTPLLTVGAGPSASRWRRVLTCAPYLLCCWL